MDNKIILKGVLQRFSPATYPGRLYGMFVWDHKKHDWVLNKFFCREFDIKTPFFYKQEDRKNKLKRIFDEK